MSTPYANITCTPSSPRLAGVGIAASLLLAFTARTEADARMGGGGGGGRGGGGFSMGGGMGGGGERFGAAVPSMLLRRRRRRRRICRALQRGSRFGNAWIGVRPIAGGGNRFAVGSSRVTGGSAARLAGTTREIRLCSLAGQAIRLRPARRSAVSAALRARSPPPPLRSSRPGNLKSRRGPRGARQSRHRQCRVPLLVGVRPPYPRPRYPPRPPPSPRFPPPRFPRQVPPPLALAMVARRHRRRLDRSCASWPYAYNYFFDYVPCTRMPMTASGPMPTTTSITASTAGTPTSIPPCGQGARAGAPVAGVREARSPASAARTRPS